MSMNYNEWPEVLFIGVWRALLMWRKETELAQNPILVLWMQFSFLRFKLKEEPYIQYRDRRHANRSTVLKTCHLLLRPTCIFSQVVGVFHVVYCEDKKKFFTVLNTSWKTSLCRYTNQVAFLLLSFTEFIPLAINISISCMAKTPDATMDALVLYIFELHG